MIDAAPHFHVSLRSRYNLRCRIDTRDRSAFSIFCGDSLVRTGKSKGQCNGNIETYVRYGIWLRIGRRWSKDCSPRCSSMAWYKLKPGMTSSSAQCAEENKIELGTILLSFPSPRPHCIARPYPVLPLFLFAACRASIRASTRATVSPSG